MHRPCLGASTAQPLVQPPNMPHCLHLQWKTCCTEPLATHFFVFYPPTTPQPTVLTPWLSWQKRWQRGVLTLGQLTSGETLWTLRLEEKTLCYNSTSSTCVMFYQCLLQWRTLYFPTHTVNNVWVKPFTLAQHRQPMKVYTSTTLKVIKDGIMLSVKQFWTNSCWVAYTLPCMVDLFQL